MPRKKIPQDAFQFYVNLGPKRSYSQTAEQLGVSKRAVVKRAVKEQWQDKLQLFEEEARRKSNEKAQESLEAMNERHLKCARLIQAKAIEALKKMPIDSAMSAVKALESAIRQERVIRGEPSDRTAVNVEETIRREYDRWMNQ